ncbi:DnaB-like helicase C-terminal domain-containing protein [Pediococcus pentosaceus]|uniref:DnaB-like helicase C-terminal domain-containing protein n=1 Tax=Pediococcus pentosaceus TaxID=1255 RepID=UPI0039ECD591
MNTEIEKEVIGILLNHPDKLEAIPLESDWFGYPEYRMLFEAMRKSASHDLFDVYGKYNQLSKTPLDFSSVKSMRDEFTLVSQLNNDIQLIRKAAYNRQLNSAIAAYQANPFSENEQALREILAKNETVESVDNGRLDEAVEELKDSLTHPKPRGISTFKKLDSVLGGGMYGSMLFTIGARPSTGKTAFSVNLAYEAMMNDGDVEVDFFTLEMNKQEMLNRFISRITGVSSSMLRSKANELDNVVKTLIDETATSLLTSKLHVYDGLENLGELSRLSEKMRLRRNQASI